MLLAASGDERRDPHLPHLLAIFVVVVAAIGVERVEPSTRTTATAPHRGDGLEQGHQLGDVVAVAAGQRHRQRDAVHFGDQMVFRDRSGVVPLGRGFVREDCGSFTRRIVYTIE
jgi:hypothetical protein